MAGRLTVLLFLLLVWTTCSPGRSADLDVSRVQEPDNGDVRNCTVDQLLPLAAANGESIASEWSDERVTELPYGCDCAHYRARYFCPHLGDDGYQIWVPRAVSDSACDSVTRSDLAAAPLPPNFRVLVYGNSHLRQVVESIMCMFHEHVSTKKVKYYEDGPGHAGDRYVTVDGDAQCRSCAPYEDEMVEYGCIAEGDAYGEACRCSDGDAEFVFANGAVLHYYFSHTQENKQVADALSHHNVSSMSYYDAVFANNGNEPMMQPAQAEEAAAELKEASVPFFWLSTYEGVKGEFGDVDGWAEGDRVRMEELGVKYVRVGTMALGLDHLRKKGVEPNTGDPHFCMPGPSDEIALLLLKLVWASYFENFESSR